MIFVLIGGGRVAKPGVLTFGHREVLENLWGLGESITRIALLVGVPVCTVSRELKRNHSYRHGTKNPRLEAFSKTDRRREAYLNGYTAVEAQKKADKKLRRPKAARLARPGPLREVVLDLLGRRWSPRQVAASLQESFPDRPEMRVCHETIYQAIYVQSRGGLRARLKEIADGQEALRTGRSRRRPVSREERPGRGSKTWVKGFHISTRPAQAADRAIPGHWEGDLVAGPRNASAIITLVERSTRYVMLGHLPNGRDTASVITALTALAERMPAHLRKSLTWDQGSELSSHATFTVATGCPVFFCDPHSPWQRGSNENTNGLLRQYFPKGKFDFRTTDQDGLDAVAHELNNRPRQTLGWASPAKRLNQILLDNAA
jgi:IS30 family transposase